MSAPQNSRGLKPSRFPGRAQAGYQLNEAIIRLL